MKVLFSTKYLAFMLKKALDNKGFNQIIFTENNWIFNRLGKNDITVKAHQTNDFQNAVPDVLQIDRAQWYRVAEFLEPLPEQPILLEIDYFGNDDIRIRLSQIIADF
jgi:hypothetical protein